MVTTPTIAQIPPTPAPPIPATIPVQIIAPPLPASATATVIKGQVVDVQPNNVITIQTDAGATITVRLPPNAPPIANGEPLAVTVPPTSPDSPRVSAPTVTIPRTSQLPVPTPPTIQDNFTSTGAPTPPTIAQQLRDLAANAIARVLGTPAQPLQAQTTTLKPITWPTALSILQSTFASTPTQNLIPTSLVYTGAVLPSASTLGAFTLAPGFFSSADLLAPSTTFTVPTSLQTGSPPTLIDPKVSSPQSLPSIPGTVNTPVLHTTPTTSPAPTTFTHAQMHAPTVFMFSPNTPNFFEISFPTLLSARAFQSSFIVVADSPDGMLIHTPERGTWSVTTTPSARLTVGSVLSAIPATSPSAGLIMGDMPEWLMPLQTLLDTLSALPAGVPRAVVPNASAPHTLAAAITLFAAAAQSGDLSAFLSDKTIETLRRAGKGADIDALARALSGAGKARGIDAPSTATEWRSFMFPMQFQGPVVPVTLYTKRLEDFGDHPDDQDSNPAKNGGGQRFILDLTFDRMGAVQFDMLYRPGQLDSVLRTELPLSSAMRTVLSEKYAGAMARVSHTGELHFQDGAKNWFTVQKSAGQMRVEA